MAGALRSVAVLSVVVLSVTVAGCGGPDGTVTRWHEPEMGGVATHPGSSAAPNASQSGAAAPTVPASAAPLPSGSATPRTPGRPPASPRPGGGGAVGGPVGGPLKGVANAACPDLRRLGVAWYYNWTLSAGGCSAPGFVPMIAGKNEKTPARVATALKAVVDAGHRTVLGFNEPNKSDQSNLTVAQVVELWPHLTTNPAVRVGSPATSADATGWFTEFMAQVRARQLRVDFVAVHWYGWNAGSCDAEAAELERYLRWAESVAGDRPIWITEWGCMHQSNPDPATVRAFYLAALDVFARHPRIERYAWYPWNTNNQLVDGSGQLTPLGTTLAGAPAHR